ncbi:MerR family transcriptional regulator [Pontibacillus salicampi]|uniref:MerR family transcriptional regulator n=1 Tax=Pontibacillus salicampi TaxID=1449801 RepID=A0ABV6LN03_9BACI
MEYTIGEVSKKLDMSTYTLRFYEKEGLLPSIKRNQQGIRKFNEDNLYWIDMVRCFRDTGMSLQDVKHIVDLTNEGHDTLEERKHILQEHKAKVQQQMDNLQQHLHKIDKKIQWYEGDTTACEIQSRV